MYNVSLEALLGVLHNHAPAKVDALSKAKRDVEFGMLSVGIKIHDLGEQMQPLLEALGSDHHVGNHYRHHRANTCLVLPPVGSARSATMLLECIDKAIAGTLFRNQNIQIQVCSPGKLSAGKLTAMLGVARYLGSDYFPRYTIDDFATTFTERPTHLTPTTFPFSYGRGKRMVIYDAGGQFDKEFAYWDSGTDHRPALRSNLPFELRTDLLDCKTSLDVRNVNLVATLLVHSEHGGYWGALGQEFINEMNELLDRHLLAEVLMAPWVCGPDAPLEENGIFGEALREVIGAVFDDAARLATGGSRSTGILFDTKELLEKYRKRLIAHARWINQGKDDGE